MDQQAFERVAREEKDRVHSYAVRMLRQAADAQDVTQEGLVRLWRHRDEVDVATARFWLVRTVHNLCIDQLRRRRASPEVHAGQGETSGPDDRYGPDRLAEASELGQAIENALGRLSAAERSAVLLREVQGLPYAEIAAILDVPLGTLKARLHRAREHLRESLLRAGVAP